LLSNADFDLGPTPSWVESSTWPGLTIVTSKDDAKLKLQGVAPASGAYLAWLGGVPDNTWDHHRVMLTQTVSIPAAASAVTLSGQRWVTTVEDPSDVFDVAYLQLSDADDNVVWLATSFSNQSVSSGWVAFSASTTDLDLVRGRTLTFVAYSNTDPAKETSFFLDSLRLVATCGR
jgi:hypothetical protein